MCAPDIIIPIKSTNKLVYLAHLGTLKLVNFFKREDGRLMDHLYFDLTDLKLNRARVAEDIEKNDIEAEIEVIKPINFKLGVVRHMGETKTKNDPPEFKIDAKLDGIQSEMSKSDYNVLLGIIHILNKPNFGLFLPI